MYLLLSVSSSNTFNLNSHGATFDAIIITKTL